MDTIPVIIHALVEKDETLYHVHTQDDTLDFEPYALMYEDLGTVKSFLSKCEDANPGIVIQWI